jgi:TonB-dependent receptor
MSIKASLMASGACMALVMMAAPAFAQEAAPAQAAPAEETVVVVTGLRKSFQNATNLKKNASQIVDSIVAEDIGKMPDTNIAETLQRIPGVQISRNTRGEGNAYVVHGLKQVMTTVNGRTFFTTTNRSANLLDFSADILSGVDVYKTATADQIEGGLGGLINIHAARPFDYKGFHLSATAAANYSSIHGDATPRLSGAVSNRWSTSHGDVGLLAGFQYEQIDSGGYQVNVGSYGARTNLYDLNGNGSLGDADDSVLVPSKQAAQYEVGERTRASFYTSGQWRPSEDLMLYTDFLWNYSGGHSSTEALSLRTGAGDGAVASGAWDFKDGTNIPQSMTFANAPLQSTASGADNPYNNYSFAVGGKWNLGKLVTTGEASYTRSVGPFYLHSMTLQSAGTTGTVTLGKTPDISLSGNVDPTNPDNFTLLNMFDLGQKSLGREIASRIDLRYDFDSGSITAVLAGARYSNHHATNDVYSITYNASTNPLSVPLSAITELTPDDLFHGHDSSLNQWTVLKSDIVHNLQSLRHLVGLPESDPFYSLGSHYTFDEKVTSAYVEALFAFNIANLPIDGNIGVRNVHTDPSQTVYVADANGAITDADGKKYNEVTGGQSYDNVLPSVNIRAKFTDDLFLRLAYSKAIARPEYGNLSPALILNQTTFTGSGGNPALKPVEADQYDASLEYYFGRSDSVAMSLFQKDVAGFVQSFASPETIDGVNYVITRPRNSGTGTIKGYELSYQQFFDFLPSFWSGLGVQANYTHVDSELSVYGQTYTVPAEQLSKDSYNFTGIYEKGPLSVHLSYNWRSKYLNSTSGDSAARPVWEAPLSSLDLSATYRLNDHVSLKADVVNLGYSYQRLYYGASPLAANASTANLNYAAPLMPSLANQLDRSFEVGIHITY